jgi:hypothetical protein
MFSRLLKYSLVLAGWCFLTGCYGPKSYEFRSVDQFKGWKILPSSTVIGKRQEFVILGRNLYSAEIITGPSVKVEKGSPNTDGTTLKVFLTVDELDELDPVDRPGKRILHVKTQDTLQMLTIKVSGE